MALQQCVHFLTVMIVLLFKGCDSQSFECGRITTNQAATAGSWPWRVFIDVTGNDVTEGSLITDQWVLTLASNVQNYSQSDIAVYQHSTEPLSSPNVYLKLENVTCDPGNELCLLKLASPVQLTDQVQPICLASESSTFYDGTECWTTTFSANSTPENYLEVIGKNECQCVNGPLSEDTICAGLKDRKSTCLGTWGAPLMNKNDSVWVQSGVLSSHNGCVEPTKAGVFVDVSDYQNWIRETVTGTPPTFVTFTSSDTGVDMYFICFNDSTAEPNTEPNTEPTAEPTIEPNTEPTAEPNTEPTAEPNTEPTTDQYTEPTIEPKDLTTTPSCDSVFCGAESLISFTHFTALCVLVVSLHVFVGSGGI